MKPPSEKTFSRLVAALEEVVERRADAPERGREPDARDEWLGAPRRRRCGPPPPRAGSRRRGCRAGARAAATAGRPGCRGPSGACSGPVPGRSRSAGVRASTLTGFSTWRDRRSIRGRTARVDASCVRACWTSAPDATPPLARVSTSLSDSSCAWMLRRVIDELLVEGAQRDVALRDAGGHLRHDGAGAVLARQQFRTGGLGRPPQAPEEVDLPVEEQPGVVGVVDVALGRLRGRGERPADVGLKSAPASAARPRNTSMRATAVIRSRLLSSASRTSAASSGSLNCSNHGRSAIDFA